MVVWSNKDADGNSHDVRGTFTGVGKTYFTGAFSTVLQDGTVEVWGSKDEGGDSEHMQPLRDGDRIRSTVSAFVAALMLWLTYNLVCWAPPLRWHYRFVTLWLLTSGLIDYWTCPTGSSTVSELSCQLIRSIVSG